MAFGSEPLPGLGPSQGLNVSASPAVGGSVCSLIFDWQKGRQARGSGCSPTRKEKVTCSLKLKLLVFCFLTKKGRAVEADTPLKVAHPFRQDPSNVRSGEPQIPTQTYWMRHVLPSWNPKSQFHTILLPFLIQATPMRVWPAGPRVM